MDSTRVSNSVTTRTKSALYASLKLIFIAVSPGAKIWPNIMLGKKMNERGRKKGGKCIFFSPIGQKYAYFFLNWLKIYKTTKEGLKFFACGAHHLNVIDFLWEQNINQEGGGNMNFTFNIHPWASLYQ